MDYYSIGVLQRLISYILEIETEAKRKSQRTERLGMGKIKGEDYVIIQFISISLCQELHNNSSGWLDQVIKYEKWEPNKLGR